MPLPPNFSSWRHLHSVLMRTYNRRVNEWFKDLAAEELSITDGRRSLRTACMIDVNDSAIVASNKMTLFSLVIQGWGGEDSAYYAVPVEDFHERVQFKPQISLLFRQPWEEVPEHKRPIESIISFRLPQEPETLNEIDLKSFARKIDAILGTRQTPFKWQRGRVKVNYTDPSKGYRLQLLASSETEGKQVISKVLQIQGHSINLDFLTVSTAPSRNFRSGAETRFLVGESRKLPRERPIGNVIFRRAELKVWGVRPDITLVDYTGLRSDWLNRP